MLPAPKPDGLSLADVMKSCLDAILGQGNRLGLVPVRNAVVVLVDGLGADVLRSSAGHARMLAGALTPKSVIESGFPTTTASALATLTTGVPPGQHGMVGYSVLDASHDRVVNQLSGWDSQFDPATWQRVPTLFETARAAALDPVVIGPARYRDSGFTRAVLRGARYVSASSAFDRVTAAAAEINTDGPAKLIYVYIPELDQAAHAHGWQSSEWTTALETADAAVRELVAALGPADGLLVTADHGLIDVPHHAHVLVDGELLRGIRFMAGEPRCLQLYFEPEATPAERRDCLDLWRESESARSWVVSREEAVAAGWFGPVDAEVLPRIGDIIVAARKGVAYYDGRIDNPKARSMVAQHGSWSPAETRVPLLRFGAFARTTR
ncbi:MAG: alkaline phosphatase family protein [Salinibacterium sp.]|nr:alkaline phosphatase family protein [Salinibacterium sp.]